MTASKIQSVVTGAAIIATLVFESFAVMTAVHMLIEGWIDSPLELAWIVTLLASPLVVLYGIYVSRQSPLLGGVVAVCAAVPMGALWFWFPPVWALGFAVALIGGLRARRLATARA